MTSDHGFVGCGGDVTERMHGLCSGRYSCEVGVPDPRLEAALGDEEGVSCGDIQRYLNASYHCVTGQYRSRVNIK